MDINLFQQIYSALQYFLAQSLAFLIKLVAAYVIWLIGRFVINSAVTILNKVDIKSWKLDDTIRNTLIKIGVPTAKFVLILVILDFLGIGSSVVGALAQGLALTVAITLGLAFGEALKPEAKRIVDDFKRESNMADKM
jgi:hypothetical protein